MREWANVAADLRSRHGVSFSDAPKPVLALIGYRFDERVRPDDAIRLVYRYHDVKFSNERLQEQTPGRVSLHDLEESASVTGHPRVSKKLATVERLQRLAPALADSFWEINQGLQALGAKATYGGKNSSAPSECRRLCSKP